MSHRTIVFVIILFITSGNYESAVAQQTSGLFASFNRYTSASQASLGSSLLSMGSAAVIFVNPAGMQYLENTQLSFTYLKLEPKLDQNFMTYAITKRFGEKFSMGIGGISYSVNNIEGYNSIAEFTEMHSLSEWLAIVSFSTSVVRPFSIGLNLKTASIDISGDLGLNEVAYAVDFGFTYQQSNWFLLSMSTQSPFLLNDDERSLPRLRSSIEIDLPFPKRNQGSALQVTTSTQTEFGHWSTGFVGIHAKYPVAKNIMIYANGRTPAFLLLTSAVTDDSQNFEPMESWGIGCGIIISMGLDFNLKLETAYLAEKYFNQLVSTIELIK